MNSANKILEEAKTGWKIKGFFQLHNILFVGLMILIAFLYLFWTFIVHTITHCIKRCKEDYDESNKHMEDSYEKDFYSCVDFHTLIEELKMVD